MWTCKKFLLKSKKDWAVCKSHVLKSIDILLLLILLMRNFNGYLFVSQSSQGEGIWMKLGQPEIRLTDILLQICYFLSKYNVYVG